MKYLISLFISLTIFSSCSNNSEKFGKAKWDADKENWTQLMIAISQKDYPKMRFLISNGSDVCQKNRDSLSAQEVAIMYGDFQTVKILYESNCLKPTNDSRGFPMIIIASHLEVKIVEKLLENGYSPNDFAPNGYSSLMAASSFGTIETMELLIENGAKIDHQRKVDGITALMLAAHNEDYEKVKFLVSKGANIDIKDLNQNRAIDYVQGNKEKYKGILK